MCFENGRDEEMYSEIKDEARQVITEFLEKANLQSGMVLVIGCSSSEMVGNLIGKGSSIEAAQAAFGEIYPRVKEKGAYLAVQCCEHLNRALVVEKELAVKKNWEIVDAIPQQNAGGSFAVTAWANFKEPVLVEHIVADAGIDIGGTLIGMHLRAVAVPLRLSVSKIGKANILCAKTRHKYIGGKRAVYQNE